MTLRLRRFLVIVLVGLGVLVVSQFVPLPFQLAFAFLGGWLVFLRDTLPRMTVDRTQLVIAGIALASFVCGLQLLLRRTVPPRFVGGRPWPWRATAAVTGLVLAMFVAGTGLVGIAHQIGWLVTSPEPLLERDTWREKFLESIEQRRRAAEAEEAGAEEASDRDSAAATLGP